MKTQGITIPARKDKVFCESSKSKLTSRPFNMIPQNYLPIAIPLYVCILGVFLIILIRDLVREKCQNWLRGAIIGDPTKQGKFNEKTRVLTITKKDNPRGYWQAIAMRIFFVLFALFVGYRLFF